MLASMLFDELVQRCRELECDVVVREWQGTVWIAIRHRIHGPIVAWTTYQSSLEETARYALLSVFAMEHEKKET
jgi:hypothetical protein